MFGCSVVCCVLLCLIKTRVTGLWLFLAIKVSWILRQELCMGLQCVCNYFLWSPLNGDFFFLKLQHSYKIQLISLLLVRIYYFSHIHARVICMFEECLLPFTPFFLSQSSSSSGSWWWLSSVGDSGSVAHQCCRAQVYFFLCSVYIIKAITWFLFLWFISRWTFEQLIDEIVQII